MQKESETDQMDESSAPLADSNLRAVEQPKTDSPSDRISADEIALYDRQIRLWGVQAQEKIRTAKILLVSMKALANEIAKNLVLAGIGELTVVDHETVKEEDLFAQFFVTEEDIGKNRAEAAAPRIRELNPRVSVNVDTQSIVEKTPGFYISYDVVIATDLPYATLNTINAAARLAKRPFYAAGSFGLYGFVFADLISHEYVIEREKPNVPTVPRTESTTRSILSVSAKKETGRSAVELVTKREIYSPLILANTSPLPPEYRVTGNTKSTSTQLVRRLRRVTPLLPCLRALWDFQSQTSRPHPDHSSKADLSLFTTLATEKHCELQLPSSTLKSEFLRSFLMNVGTEMAPVAAFVGGMLAQDVINVLGHREQPLQNFMLFDGDACDGPIYAMHPVFAPEINAKVSAAEAAAVVGATMSAAVNDGGGGAVDGGNSILQAAAPVA